MHRVTIRFFGCRHPGKTLFVRALLLLILLASAGCFPTQRMLTGWDSDRDGYSAESDCDPADPLVYPGAPELCDGKDNNCNGTVDEGCRQDSDGDGVMDSVDNCPDAPNPPVAEWTDRSGHRHHHSQRDFNLNELGDACDDSDYDGILDVDDPCPSDPENDLDGDGVCSGAGFTPGSFIRSDGRAIVLLGDHDNCPGVSNPPAATWVDHRGKAHSSSQPDYNLNAIGDPCDAETIMGGEPAADAGSTVIADPDGDGLSEKQEAKLGTSPNHADTDEDGVLDGADDCPTRPNPVNAQWFDRNGVLHISSQPDLDLDGAGDACDRDKDGDGVPDKRADLTPMPVSSGGDNCPGVPNPIVAKWKDKNGKMHTNSQPDFDLDEVGDACDPDLDGDGLPDRQELARGISPTNPDTDEDGIPDGVDPDPDSNRESPRASIVIKAYADTSFQNEVTSSWLPTDFNSVVMVAFLRSPDGVVTNLVDTVAFALTPSRLEGAATNESEKRSNTICSNDFSFSKTDKDSLSHTVVLGSETVNLDGVVAAPVTVHSFDFGGRTTVTASTTYQGAPVQGWITLPLDTDGDGLPDAWESQNGFDALDAFSLDATRTRTDAQMDIDTSQGNTQAGDGLTNFKEYRGIIFDGPGGLRSHQRLDPRKKDLFVRGDGFKSSTLCLSTPAAAFCATPDLLDFNIGAMPGENFSNAFENAGIAVHDVTGMASFSDPVQEPPNIDILFVANNTTSTNTIRRAFSPGINQAGARSWTWDEKGASYFGDAQAYHYDPITGNKGSYVYHLNLMHYFWNRPYKECPGPNNQFNCPGLLDPLSKVEDGKKVENGVLDKGEDDNHNKLLDWDRLDSSWKTGLTATSYRVGSHYSPFDVNANGKVDIPGDTANLCSGAPPREYTADQVQRHTIIHEMGHAVGIRNPEHTSDPTCVMYSDFNNWDRAGHFCPAALSQIQIHNQ